MNPKYLFFMFLTFFEVVSAHQETNSGVFVRRGDIHEPVIKANFSQTAYNSDFLAYSNSNPTKASVSLNLSGYVNPEVNIERIDEGTTLDVFKNDEARFRVTCNNDKTVIVTFNTKNGWKLLSENGNSISYEGIFKGNNKRETVNEKNNTVDIENHEFENSEYEFGVRFKSVEKNLKAGKYSDRITISVSTAY